MNVILKYIECEEYKICEAAVIGSFNGYDANKGRMNKQGNEWRFECSLPIGVYHYRFLINKKLLLNDPWNNLFEQKEGHELWSVLYINKQGLRLCNPEVYHPTIKRCELAGKIKLANKLRKNYLDLLKMDEITATLYFDKLYGLHTVTAAWYLPNGELFSCKEQMVYASLLYDGQEVRFSLESKEVLKRGTEGKWIVVLFFDGAYYIKKEFIVQKDCIKTYFEKGQKLHS